jgi:hypothetical protein
MKVTNPFSTVSILLPEDVLESNEDNVFSYWKKGDTCLLQLSRFPQPGARSSAKQYLTERTMIHGNWKPFELPGKPQGCEFAAATMVSDQGTSFVQVYLVWPSFVVHATVSLQRQLEVCEWVWESLASVRAVKPNASLLRSIA